MKIKVLFYMVFLLKNWGLLWIKLRCSSIIYEIIVLLKIPVLYLDNQISDCDTPAVQDTVKRDDC